MNQSKMRSKVIPISILALLVATSPGCGDEPRASLGLLDSTLTYDQAILDLRAEQVIIATRNPNSPNASQITISVDPDALAINGSRFPLDPQLTSAGGISLLTSPFYDDTNPQGGIVDLLVRECSASGDLSDPPWLTINSAGATTSPCGAGNNSLAQYLCTANRLEELANATRPTRIHEWSEDGAIEIPVQSTAVRAALHELTIRLLAQGSGALLHHVYGFPLLFPSGSSANSASAFQYQIATCETDDIDNPGMRQIDLIGARLSEYFVLAREAMMNAERDYLALADEEFSKRPNRSEAFAASMAIRALIGSIQRGGGGSDHLDGWLRDISGGTYDPLTPADEQALDVLRSVGLPPADVMDLPSDNTSAPGRPIASLLTDVRTRYANLMGDVSVSGSTAAGVAAMSVDAFLESLNLTEANFIRARLQLVTDLAVFVRDTTEEQHGEPTYTTTNMAGYAATSSEPQPVPAIYLSHLAAVRDAPLPTGGGGQALWPLGTSQERFGYAQILRHLDMIGNALELMNHCSTYPCSATPNATLAADFADEAGELREGLDLELEGYVAVRGTAAPNLFIEVISKHPTDSLAIVTSLRGLRCAEQGNIEGVPCQWSDVGAITPQGAGTINDLAKVLGFPYATVSTRNLSILKGLLGHGTPARRTTMYFGIGPTMTATIERVYVMRLRPGGTAGTPGSYDAIGSIEAYPGQEYRAISELMPTSSERSGGLLQAAADEPGRPEVTCAAAFSDSRLPLEDELTDDGNQYENSWYRYLQIAAQAASEADLRGEEAIAAQLEVDRLSEEAAEELEGICGVAANLDLIQSRIDSVTDGDPVAILADLASTYEDTSLRRLRDCIDPANIVQWAALGSTPLCAWADASDSTLCGWGAGSEPPVHCPRRMSPSEVASGTCPVPPGAPAGTVGRAITADDLLMVFSSPDDGAREDETVHEQCLSLMHTLRYQMGQASPSASVIEDSHEKLFQNAFYSQQSLKRLAHGIRWAARPGNYSSLYVNGGELISTGTRPGGPSSSGLCDPNTTEASVGCDGGMKSGLLCSSYDCATELDRVQLNIRLARAATLARWLAGESFEGFEVPTYSTGWTSSSARGERDIEDPYLPDPGAHAYDGYLIESFIHEDHSTRRYFCVEPYGRTPHPLNPLWYFYRPEAPTESEYGENVICGENSFFITRLEGDQSYGGRAVGRSVIDENANRAAYILNDLRGPLGLRNPIYESIWTNGLVQTARAPGLDTDTFTWIEGHDTDHNSSPYHRDIGLRSVNWPVSPDETRIQARALFDALELYCAAGLGMGMDPDTLQSSTTTDLDTLVQIVQYAADELRNSAELMVLRDVPVDVFRSIRSGSTTSVPTATAGEYGAELLELRAAMNDMSTIPLQIAAELDSVGREADQLRIAEDVAELEGELLDVEFKSTMSRELTNCLIATFEIQKNTSTNDWLSGGLAGSILAAAATCANSVAQIKFAADARNLRDQINNLELQSSVITFQDQAARHEVVLRGYLAQLESMTDRLNASTTRLEDVRRRAERALARALFLDRDDTGHIFRSNTTLRNRLSTARVRYQRAREDAIRMAHLAKLAIEQRFGVRLSTMDDDMTLVDAPSTWEATLCTMDGIDYRASGRTDPNSSGSSTSASGNYSDGYIGEYVKKLERFVDSYRLDYPFQNAEDVAVVSLRDDILNVRAQCSVPVGNLLFHSALLHREVTEVAPGWQENGACTYAGCVRALPQPDALGPTTTSGPFGTPEPYRITFGPMHPSCYPVDSLGNVDPVGGTPTDCPCGTATGAGVGCGYVPEAGWGQSLGELFEGKYRVSWYARVPYADSEYCSSTTPTPCSENDSSRAVVVRGERTGTEWSSASPYSVTAVGGWKRYYYTFQVSSAEEAFLEILSWTGDAGSEIDIAGLMVERVDGSDSAAPPGPFAATADTLEVPIKMCEDTDGSEFRANGWRYNCVALCPDGYGGECNSDDATEYCYWETDFQITQRDLEAGTVFGQAGFALGNFNYRIDELAVNFVGTGARICSDSALPSTCYNAGWIPYSLDHNPPFTVRNNWGEDFEAELFPGHIEHARGLAAERYLTNPISSADMSLIGGYVQRQFRGRPLPGTYTLRIWDVPGVNWSGIEDVQIYLRYRFWTRFN